MVPTEGFENVSLPSAALFYQLANNPLTKCLRYVSHISIITAIFKTKLLKPLNSTLLLSTQNDDDKKKNNTDDNDGDCT